MTSLERQEASNRFQSTRSYNKNRSDSVLSSYGDLPAPLPQQQQRQVPQGGQPPSAGAMISIAVDPVALITTECITVTSAMRKHTRWAQSSVSAILGGGAPAREVGRPVRQQDKGLSPPKQSDRPSSAANGLEREDDDTLANRWGLRGKKGKSIQDIPLMSAFARLRNDLRGCAGQIPHLICLSEEKTDSQQT